MVIAVILKIAARTRRAPPTRSPRAFLKPSLLCRPRDAVGDPIRQRLPFEGRCLGGRRRSRRPCPVPFPEEEIVLTSPWTRDKAALRFHISAQICRKHFRGGI